MAAGAQTCLKCNAVARGSPSYLGWLAMGGIGVAVVAGLALSGPSKDPAPLEPMNPPSVAPVPVMAGGAPAGPAMPKLPASPRQIADDLFNDAMAATESGDGAAAKEAVPRALGAYLALESLDDDGAFHVALLQLTGGDFARARATAEAILSRQPAHLLALSVAARAAAGAGDAAGARKYNEKLVASYDSEVNKPLPEYRDHARVLPIQRDQAQQALGAK